jgi:hypothetical protein
MSPLPWITSLFISGLDLEQSWSAPMEASGTLPPLAALLITYTAGKSTLLQILAGKRLVKDAEIRINGLDVFRDSPPGVTFLGTEWSVTSYPHHDRNSPSRFDCPVLQGNESSSPE